MIIYQYSLGGGKGHFTITVLIGNKREATKIKLYNPKKILHVTPRNPPAYGKLYVGIKRLKLTQIRQVRTY